MMKRIHVRAVLCMALTAAMLQGTAVSAAFGEADVWEADEAEIEIPKGELIKNEEGDIVGVDVTEVPVDEVAFDYEFISFQELINSDLFEEYEKLGMTCDKESEKLYFYGMEIVSLTDSNRDGNVVQYDAEELEGAENAAAVYVARDETYQLEYFILNRNWEYLSGDYDTEENEAYSDEAERSVIGGADKPASIVLD